MQIGCLWRKTINSRAELLKIHDRWRRKRYSPLLRRPAIHKETECIFKFKIGRLYLQLPFWAEAAFREIRKNLHLTRAAWNFSRRCVERRSRSTTFIRFMVGQQKLALTFTSLRGSASGTKMEIFNSFVTGGTFPNWICPFDGWWSYLARSIRQIVLNVVPLSVVLLAIWMGHDGIEDRWREMLNTACGIVVDISHSHSSAGNVIPQLFYL